MVERAYAEAISSCGGLPRLLPGLSGATAEDLHGLDGLLLSGGGDVDPSLYGAPRAAATGGVDTARDGEEIALVWQALTVSLPVLGICRGCQILNVAFGGTLVQDLPAQTTQPHLVPERTKIVHRICIEPGTQLFGLEQRASIGVNSIHHQAVHTVGRGLRGSAWADDGTIEAVEHRRRPILGVQWHPENLLSEPAHMALFAWLVGQAVARQTGQADASRREEAGYE